MDTYRTAFLAGALDQAPGALGNIPFGLITGAAAVAAGLDPALAIGMSILVFAGAAQLVALQLISDGAHGLIIVLAVLVVNLRMMMYSAALAPLFSSLSLRWKLLTGYLLTDHAFALMAARFKPDDGKPNKHWYYLGAGSLMWVVWQLSIVAGVLIGVQAPSAWSVDFLIPLMFISLVVPALKTRPQWVAAACASVAAVFTSPFPLKSGLMVAALMGVVGGLLSEQRRAGSGS